MNVVLMLRQPARIPLLDLDARLPTIRILHRRRFGRLHSAEHWRILMQLRLKWILLVPA